MSALVFRNEASTSLIMALRILAYTIAMKWDTCKMFTTWKHVKIRAFTCNAFPLPELFHDTTILSFPNVLKLISMRSHTQSCFHKSALADRKSDQYMCSFDTPTFFRHTQSLAALSGCSYPFLMLVFTVIGQHRPCTGAFKTTGNSGETMSSYHDVGSWRIPRSQLFWTRHYESRDFFQDCDLGL